MNDPVKRALEQLDTAAGGVATRNGGGGSAPIPAMPARPSKAQQAMIDADARELVEMNRAARMRLLGETLEMAQEQLSEALVEREEAVTVGVAKGGRSRPARTYGGMATDAEMVRVREILRVNLYGWCVAVARMTGVSLSALKTARDGKALRADLAEKVARLRVEEIREEVARGRQAKSDRAKAEGMGGAPEVDLATDAEVVALHQLVWPPLMKPMWISALKERCRISGGSWVKLKRGHRVKRVLLEMVRAAVLDPETEVLRQKMASGKAVDADLAQLAARAGV